MPRRLASRRPPLPAVAALLGSLVALLGLTRVLNGAGIPIWSLTADPGPLIEDFHWNTGALSILGSVLWGVVASLLLLTATVLRRRGEQPAIAAALLATALVVAAWGADDTLLLHDLWVPSLGGSELVFTAALALVSLAVLWPHRRALRRTGTTLPALAAVGFAVSTGLDAVHVGDAEEDMAKLWALVLLTVWAWRIALRMIAPGAGPSSVERVVSLVDVASGLPADRTAPLPGAPGVRTKVIP